MSVPLSIACFLSDFYHFTAEGHLIISQGVATYLVSRRLTHVTYHMTQRHIVYVRGGVRDVDLVPGSSCSGGVFGGCSGPVLSHLRD